MQSAKSIGSIGFNALKAGLQNGSFRVRLKALPLRHKLVAIAISAATIVSSLALTQLMPRQYASSVVLSFDAWTKESARDAAVAILSDHALTAKATKLRLQNTPGPLRTHLTIEDPEPSRVFLTWRSHDPMQAVAMANAAAAILSSPASTPSAAKPTIRPAVVAIPTATPTTNPIPPAALRPNAVPQLSQQQMQRQTILQDEKQLQAQLDETEQKLALLDAEETRQQSTIESAKADLQHQISPRHPVETDQTRLDATLRELKNLRKLRMTLLQRLGDDGARGEDLPAGIAASHSQTALRTQPKAKPGTQTGTEPATVAPPTTTVVVSLPPARSAFAVLEPARTAQSLNAMRWLFEGLSITVGVAFGCFYLAFALWRFRAVETLAALKELFPVTYVGTIPRMVR